MRQCLLLLSLVLCVVFRAHFAKMSAYSVRQTEAMMDASPDLEAAVNAGRESLDGDPESLPPPTLAELEQYQRAFDEAQSVTAIR